MKSDDVVATLSALAQEHRLEVFRLLVKAGPQGMAAGEISTELGVAKPTLSFHLKELRAAGLISSTREGRSIRFSLREEGVTELFTYLMADCCQGRPELCGGAVVTKSCCDE